MAVAVIWGVLFQSTLPVWGATVSAGRLIAGIKISIHAPRVGSDAVNMAPSLPPEFQSTLPVWGATLEAGKYLKPDIISIHAPRVGSDVARPKVLRRP